jgi:hypothetical protein
MAEAKKSAQVLDAALIVQTIERLHARIEARFVGSGLGRVCADLGDVAKRTAQRAHRSNRPNFSLRLLGLVFVGVWLVVLVYLGRTVNWIDVLHHNDLVSLAQPLESLVNLTLLIGAAAWFIWSREIHLKRKRVYRALYQLRSMAHVIDMHQLTKDPSVELGTYKVTDVSPTRVLSDFELSRYLDYCTEMLALIAKLAALYASETEDAEILAAVNDMEDLTTSLGRKIWQKIMVIGQLGDRTASTGA